MTIQRMLGFLLPIVQSELPNFGVLELHLWVWEWQMTEEGGIVLGAGQGEGLQSQQPQHKIGDPGSSLVQWGQWLWVFHMGGIFCLDMR